LRDANEVRVAALEEKAGGQASLENAFDALRILTFIERIAVTVQCYDEAAQDFEERRSEMLSDMEQRFAEMVAARDLAAREAQWNKVVGPNRQQRRHPGPQGIVRP
jgi:hypothetical protein